MAVIQHYVLFPNHDNAMRLYRGTKELGIKAVIAPTPRAASVCCGVSLLVKEEDLEVIKEYIHKNEVEITGFFEIEKDVNPNRDRYC